MRDPEMYNYVRQVLETMKQDNTALTDALGTHGHNMHGTEVRGTIADSTALQRPSDDVMEARDR